jgi:opacity protein-like surface antigen
VKRQFMSVVCASVLLGATSMAFAGARGEPEEPEEMPAAAPAPAVAAIEEEPEGHWYVGAAALVGFENFHCEADEAWGYNIRAGRRFNRWAAAEVQFDHPVDKYDDADKVDGFGRLHGDVNAWDLTANGRFYPIEGHFEPYAVVGAGYGEADLPHDQNHGFVARFGAGIDFPINSRFGLTTGADYILGTGAMSDYDQILVSLGGFVMF